MDHKKLTALARKHAPRFKRPRKWDEETVRQLCQATITHYEPAINGAHLQLGKVKRQRYGMAMSKKIRAALQAARQTDKKVTSIIEAEKKLTKEKPNYAAYADALEHSAELVKELEHLKNRAALSAGNTRIKHKVGPPTNKPLRELEAALSRILFASGIEGSTTRAIRIDHLFAVNHLPRRSGLETAISKITS